MSNEKILEGTTTVGITCKDGVVFASERRASMGNLVAHKVAEKIFKIDDNIGATIAGSVAGAQNLMKLMRAEVSLYKLRNGEEMSINAASNLTSNILGANPAYVQILIGGPSLSGPRNPSTQSRALDHRRFHPRRFAYRLRGPQSPRR